MYFMCDKILYFYHNECADSSEPQWELKLFSWNLEYQNTYSNWYHGQNDYQNNSLGKSVWKKSEAPVIFLTVIIISSVSNL